MNLTETAVLLNGIALYDNRDVDVELAQVWHAHLADVPFTDAAAAVRAHFDQSKDWIMPSDVKNLIRQQRANRLANTALVYDGDPDETPAQYLANIRARIAAIAAGQPSAPLPQALGRRPVAELVAGTADQAALPAPIAAAIERARPIELAVPCPVDGCRGAVGQRCGWGRTRMSGFHPSREAAAQTATFRRQVEPDNQSGAGEIA